jgi:sulfotransferase family protein
VTESSTVDALQMQTIRTPDIVHIGYPKAASTYLKNFLESHPGVTTDDNSLSRHVLLPQLENIALIPKPHANKIHISRDEGIAESVCIVGDPENWRRYKYKPDAWDRVQDDIVVDPAKKALRLHKVIPRLKILMLIREQADWLESAYRYSMSQLPPDRRSFADFCSTPTGVVLLQAGHFDKTIQAYIDVFGSDHVQVLHFEDIISEPKSFATRLCNFIGVAERSLPQPRENSTHAQIAKMQRQFPVIERLPTNVKTALKSVARKTLPGGRKSILSSSDIERLRSMYRDSNQRTMQLLRRLPVR